MTPCITAFSKAQFFWKFGNGEDLLANFATAISVVSYMKMLIYIVAIR